MLPPNLYVQEATQIQSSSICADFQQDLIQFLKLFWFYFLITALATSRFADKTSYFLQSYDLCYTLRIPVIWWLKTCNYVIHYLSPLFSTVCPVNVNTGEGVKCMTAILNYIPEAWLAAYFIRVTSLHRKYQHHFSTKCFMPSTVKKQT